MPSESNGPWEVLAARATAFTSEEPPNHSETWLKLLDQEPDQFVDSRKDRKSVLSGVYEESKLVYQSTPGRLDWFIQPIKTDFEDGFSTLGSYPGCLSCFIDLIKKWLSTLGGVNRLAFCPTLIIPVSKLEEGYTALIKYLPSISIDTVGVSDFFYQINRARDLSLQGNDLRINRLSKWSVITVETRDLIITANDKTPPETKEGPSYNAVKLDLDINNLPTDGLDKETLNLLFDKLLSFSDEIAVNGDVK